ncbi:ABC transporter permease [Nocardioides sp. LHG3406-4]|uniref:ABC transporter permease n=1 Tax=Nocardioides sp. LHG3406-4 TaxID=2804575 RepID=UPI003CE82629
MTGLGQLVRAYLRRDRWLLVWWTLGITVLYYSQAASVKGLYATQAEFDRAAASMDDNPALVAMAGPARALNTVGGQVTWQASAFGAICIALMCMFLVGRHTRAEEESGRDELLRAAAVGRTAPLAAAAVVSALASLLVGACVALSLVAVPLAGADSWALGLGLTATGWAFTGIAMVAAQLTSGVRAMYGLTGAVVGAAYLLRAIGDVGSPLLTWISPIGWYQGMHAFSGLRWWPIALLVTLALLTGAASYAVFARRDYGSGVLGVRPGPARGSGALTTPLGLAWHQHRGSVVGWTLGMAVAGLAYGSLGTDVGDMLGDSGATTDVFVRGGGDLVDGFYATSIVMLGLICAGFAVSSALRPRTEEDDGRVEGLLATALTRRAWLAAHVTMTVLGTVAVVLAAGLGLGTGYALSADDAGAVGRFTLATLPMVAPVLVLAAFTRLLYGVLPRAATLGWLALGFAVAVLFFGPLLDLPTWVQDVSPFQHLALTPVEDFRWTPLLGLLLVATLLSFGGQWGFRRRDLR